MVTPTRPRTTEDLFAAIHRSKRKVLGRRESDDDKSSRGGSGSQSPQSPPVTPTGTTPQTPPAAPAVSSSLPRQTSAIQRNLRKSATSSDTFKALLLKKGSRSETSFRMSAAEMLRSTAPSFQRTRSESSLDPPRLASSPSSSPPTTPHGSPCASSPSRRAAEEWNRNEGLMTFSSSPTTTYSSSSSSSPSSSYLSGMKYGRSRTPPSAASSKYNARCRILSSPMTVICEREGELAESEGGDATDGGVCRVLLATRPHPLATRPHPLLQNSNGTLSEESSS